MAVNNTMQDESGKSAKSTEEIQSWLINHIAGLMYVEPNTINIQASFNSFGLSSRDAVMLSGDLEEWLDMRLSPTLLYEYPTIIALAEYLSNEQKSTPTQLAITQGVRDYIPTKANEEHETSNVKLDELEEMSEDAAEALLLDQLNKLKS